MAIKKIHEYKIMGKKQQQKSKVSTIHINYFCITYNIFRLVAPEKIIVGILLVLEQLNV